MIARCREWYARYGPKSSRASYRYEEMTKEQQEAFDAVFQQMGQTFDKMGDLFKKLP